MKILLFVSHILLLSSALAYSEEVTQYMNTHQLTSAKMLQLVNCKESLQELLQSTSQEFISGFVLNKEATTDYFDNKSDDTLLRPISENKKYKILKELTSKPKAYLSAMETFENCKGITFYLVEHLMHVFRMMNESERITFCPEFFAKQEQIF